MAIHLTKPTLTFDEFAGQALCFEELELLATYEDPSKQRQQIYPMEFAIKALKITAGHLVREKRMTPQLFSEMFGPRPSSAAGPAMFLASSPRLCDVGDCPGPADVEESLCDAFVVYGLDLLVHRREPELRRAATTFLDMLGGWALKMTRSRHQWARRLSDIANALLFVSYGIFTWSRMWALSRIQVATDVAATKVRKALHKAPWDIKTRRAWNTVSVEINRRRVRDSLATTCARRPEAWDEAAKTLPALRKSTWRGATASIESAMWQVLLGQYIVFQEACLEAGREVAHAQVLLGRLQVGRILAFPDQPSMTSLDTMEAALNDRVTRSDVEGKQAALYLAAAKLPTDVSAGPEDANALRSKIAAVSWAAKACDGMEMRSTKLGQARGWLSDYAESVAAAGSLHEGADVGLAAAICARAVEDLMQPWPPLAVRARLMNITATLKVQIAAAEFDRLGTDFEERLAADSKRVLDGMMNKLACLDRLTSDEARDLPPVDEARAIDSAYRCHVTQKAWRELAAVQAKLMCLIEPSWKSDVPDDTEWPELCAIGADLLSHSDCGEVMGATIQLETAGPAVPKPADQAPSSDSQTRSQH